MGSPPPEPRAAGTFITSSLASLVMSPSGSWPQLRLVDRGGGLVDLDRVHALAAVRLQRGVEPADACEQVDEAERGRVGHAGSLVRAQPTGSGIERRVVDQVFELSDSAGCALATDAGSSRTSHSQTRTTFQPASSARRVERASRALGGLELRLPQRGVRTCRPAVWESAPGSRARSHRPRTPPHVRARQHQIGSAALRDASMEPEPGAGGMQRPAQQHLRLRVLRPATAQAWLRSRAHPPISHIPIVPCPIRRSPTSPHDRNWQAGGSRLQYGPVIVAGDERGSNDHR